MGLPAPAPDTTVLITGASSGIGAALAREFAARRHGVTLVARRRERLEELAAELDRDHGVRADVLPCDLANPAARAKLIAEIRAGGRDVVAVCNSAGFGTFGRFQDLPLARELEQVRLNVEALQELTGAFLGEMIERGAGAILNLASITAFQPLPGNATYAATKAFVLAFSEAVHTDLSGTGVSCTVLCPGPVHTEFGAVAGTDPLMDSSPDFLWQSPAEVARAGVEAMVRGRRTVIPGVTNRLFAVGGRFAPRSLLLPAARRLTAGRLD